MTLSFALLGAGLSIVKYQTYNYFAWHAGKKLHEDCLERVLNAPINLYFDTKPIGQILGRFHEGMGMHAWHNIDHLLHCVYGVMESVGFSVYVIW